MVAGEEFDLESRLLERRVDLIDAITRSGLVLVVVTVGVAALLGAVFIGLGSHSYAAPAAVWAILGPIYGGIATYYFAPRRRG